MSTALASPIRAFDRQLFELVNGIDILNAVAPLNYKEQRERFFSSNFSVNPDYRYRVQKIDAFKKKRALFNLPIEILGDEDLVALYEGVITSYVDKIDQFKSIGTPEFLYDSLRYYGEPNEKDIRNANFILHLPDDSVEGDDSLLSAQAIVQHLEAFAQKQGYEYSIKIDDSMIANALVSKLTVKVNSAAKISAAEVNALAHHELGVHLLTTLNAREQPLRILSLGCPVNTMTQEGMAILNEYLAGYMTVSRLKILALRVLAVDSMMREKDFKKTFQFLIDQHGVEVNKAFIITARVYRGGGFTKDYLYLQGLHQMLNAYEHRGDFNNLLCGKVSIENLDLITRLIDKGYLLAPRFISPAIMSPVENDLIKQFITHAIK